MGDTLTTICIMRTRIASPGRCIRPFLIRECRVARVQVRFKPLPTLFRGAPLKFWLDHLDRHKVLHSGIQERFGQSFIRLSHPCGLQLEVIEDGADGRRGWTTDEISSEVTTRGFHGPVLSVREIAETERFFIEALGFRKTGVDGAYHRFEIGSGGAAKTSRWFMSRTDRRGVGRSAQERLTISRSQSKTTKSSLNRKDFMTS